MGHGRTTTVEIRADLLEELREIFPGRSDREIVEGIVREYLVRLEEAEHRALEAFVRDAVGTPTEETTTPVIGRRDDAMLDALASAPWDDEASTQDENDSAPDAIAEYRRGEAMGSGQIKHELRLD